LSQCGNTRSTVQALGVRIAEITQFPPSSFIVHTSEATFALTVKDREHNKRMQNKAKHFLYLSQNTFGLQDAIMKKASIVQVNVWER
jgi:hypothetical protein